MSNHTIATAAIAYEPKKAKNITELASIDTSLILQLEVGQDFEYNYFEVNDEKYRVPDSVLAQLKAILAKKPNLKTFSVSKVGEGLQTRYTVIPLD